MIRVGILKTRFNAFDEVELKLKDGRIVKGIIQPIKTIDNLWLVTENGMCFIRTKEIEDCIIH